MILTNIIGSKLFYALPNFLPSGFFGEKITLTTGIITYPITFLVTDIVSEVYGRKRANFMVILGFFASISSLIFILIARVLPGSDVWVDGNSYFSSINEMNLAFESVFSAPTILIFASMTAYLIAQFIDIRLFHFFKKITKEKYLWFRNNGSTAISQLIDTIIVNFIFLNFGLGLSIDIIVKVIISAYIFKILFAIIDTPFVYLGVNYLKKI